MDVLQGIGVDGLRAIIWGVAITALVIVAALQIWLPITGKWRTSWRHATLVVLRSLLAGAVTFVLASLAMVFYIMAHATDARWSVGRNAHVDTPKLSAGIPLFNDIVSALNSFAGSVENGVNDVLAIKNAFLVSGEFLIMALWGLVAVVCAAIPVLLLSRYLEWWRMHQVDELVRHNQQLQANIDDVRAQMNLGPFIPRKPN